MFSLKDKVALVTGASQGIGRATSLALAEAGAKVGVAARSADKLASLVAEIEGAGGEALAVPMDVADAAQVKTGFQQVAREVRPARHSREQRGDHARHAGPAHEARRLGRGVAHESHRRASVHPAGAGRDAEAALRPHHQYHLRWSRETGNAGQANYVASKAGLIGLTRAIAVEVASRNITVNAVAPGFIETPMTDVLSQELKDKMKALIPLGRFGTDREIAAAIVFLASDEAGYITGQVLDVNGGMHMG